MCRQQRDMGHTHIWDTHTTCKGASLLRSVALERCLYAYGVATISRRLKITGLFCKRARLKRRYSAKETYSFKEPTNRSHPIGREGKSTKHKPLAQKYLKGLCFGECVL